MRRSYFAFLLAFLVLTVPQAVAAGGAVRFLRDVKLPPSTAPQAVRQAFAARRFAVGSPRVAVRVHSSRGSYVLWASSARGGGWCEGLQEPRARFNRMSVYCVWPRPWMRRRLDLTGYGPRRFLFIGRVPQQSARSLRLRLSDGRSLPVPTRDGFFLFLIPDRVLAQTAPRALVAADAQGRLVAQEAIQLLPPSLGGVGITHPPGGANLRQKRQLVARATALGRASLWGAPSSLAPSHCTWLQIGHAVYGGSCTHDRPPPHGLYEVVPLRFRIKGRLLTLLWGQVGKDVARLSIAFQDKSHTTLSHRNGVFLYPVPDSRWGKGHRPAFVVARDKQNRVLSKRLLYEYTLAP